MSAVQFESEYQRPPEDPPFHLHIHVIPRFQSFDVPELLQLTVGSSTWVDGWQIPRLYQKGVVPECYRPHSSEWSVRTSALMTHLRSKLAVPNGFRSS